MAATVDAIVCAISADRKTMVEENRCGRVCVMSCTMPLRLASLSSCARSTSTFRVRKKKSRLRVCATLEAGSEASGLTAFIKSFMV